MSKFATEIVDTTTGNVTKAASVAVDEICARCKHPCKESKHAEDIKLFPGQKNVSSSVMIPAPTIVFGPAPSEVEEPSEETQQQILEAVGFGPTPLTVGDLSGSTKKKKKQDKASVGDLYQGPVPPEKNPMTPCQEIESKRIQAAQDRVDAGLKMRQLLAVQREEAKQGT